METLDLQQFNPDKATLLKLKEECTGLKIKGVDDKIGYDLVHSKRMVLKTTRGDITKKGKELRQNALDFQKKVISYEKELIEIIEPIERDLEEKEKFIDLEKEKIKRQSLLPERLEKLTKIDCIISNDEILSMDDNSFERFFNDKNTLFLEEKQRQVEEANVRLEEERKKIQEDKDKVEAEKKRQIEEAKIKLEEEKKKIQEAKEKEVAEKQRQIELEQARKEAEEKAKLEMESKIKREAEERQRLEAEKLRQEKEEAEKLEKRKKYQKFLKDNSYTDESEFKIIKDNSKITLYKKVAEFNL